MTTEGEIQDAVRLALGNVDGLCVWRNNIGKTETNGRWIAYGVGGPGGADLIGVYRGRFIAIEIKTPRGTQTDEQRRFQRLVELRGGIYVVLRSVAEARSWVATL